MHLDKRAGAISKDYHVSLGQEIMYFENLPEYLDKGKALTMAGGRYVLVEFEPMDSLAGLRGRSGSWYRHPTFRWLPMRSGINVSQRKV